jgi:prepilin-type processing-associated H-X9-DG protein
MGYYAGSVWYKKWDQNVSDPIPPGGYPGSGDGFSTPYTRRTYWWRSRGIVLVEGDINFNRAIGAGGADSTGRYGVYTTRHMRGANYLLGDGHAEWNQTWNQSDTPGLGTPPAKTWTKYPESNWSDAGNRQPRDSSVWGHNPYGINGNAPR